MTNNDQSDEIIEVIENDQNDQKLVNDRWIGIGIGIGRTWRFGKVRPNHRTTAEPIY